MESCIGTIAKVALAVAACVMSPGSASAATGASDTATPQYRTGTAATTANKFDCDGWGCDFVITTKTTNYPCNSELVVLASGQPALLYLNTFCQATISGTFDFIGEEGSSVCSLHAFQSLGVSFTSGANALFNGSFHASGVFKPTSFSSDGLYIKQARVTVKGSDDLDGNPFGTGSIAGATFTVAFPGTGLHYSMCYPYTGSSDGYVSAVPSHGTITIAP